MLLLLAPGAPEDANRRVALAFACLVAGLFNNSRSFLGRNGYPLVNIQKTMENHHV